MCVSTVTGKKQNISEGRTHISLFHAASLLKQKRDASYQTKYARVGIDESTFISSVFKRINYTPPPTHSSPSHTRKHICTTVMIRGTVKGGKLG